MELLNSTLDPISSIISIISLVFIAGIVIPKKLHWKYLAITAIPLFALAFLQMIIFEDSVGWDYFFDFGPPTFIALSWIWGKQV